jgi:hypothetical protein
MSEWEYLKINLSELPRTADEVDVLNAAGREGWELVAVTNLNIAFLKRTVSEPAPTTGRKRRVQEK